MTRRAVVSEGSRKIIFWSFFNVMRKKPLPHVATPEWNEHRFRIWRYYTCASILQQTLPSFEYWFICDDSLQALSEPFRSLLPDPRVKLVFHSQLVSLARALADHPTVIFARIDSDDMYHPTVAEVLASAPISEPFFQFNRGYFLDIHNGRLHDWTSVSSPFFARIYRGDELRTLEAFETPVHHDVRHRARVLGRGMFMVLFHGKNTSTSPASRSCGQEHLGARRDEILAEFHVPPLESMGMDGT